MPYTIYNDRTEQLPGKCTYFLHSGGTGTVETTVAAYDYLFRSGIKRSKPVGGNPGGAFILPTEYTLRAQHYVQLPYESKIGRHPRVSRVHGMPFCLRSFGEHTLIGDSIGWWAGSLDESNLRNGVITDARLKVKDQSVNWAQAWAERRMTAGLLADSINRIARSISALRRGNWRDAGRWLKQNWKQAPESWLEYQYGWKPLVSDVVGSCEALAKLTNLADWGVSVKSSRSQSRKYYKDHIDGDGSIDWRMIFEGDKSIGGFCRFDFKPTDSFLAALSNNTGTSNPFLLGWELMPYSFVLDWGVQVGDWLSSLDATQYMALSGGSYTFRKELTVVGTPKDTVRGNGITCFPQTAGSSTAWYRRFELGREVFSSWPIASAPRFKDPLSMTRVANALSLLAVALKSGKPRLR